MCRPPSCIRHRPESPPSRQASWRIPQARIRRHLPRREFLIHPTQECAGFRPGIFKAYVQCFQPRRGATYQPRASAAASAAKRRPGVVVRQGTSPERATQGVVFHGLPPWARYDCFALSGLPCGYLQTPRATLRVACPGLICRRPFGAEEKAIFHKILARPCQHFEVLPHCVDHPL